MLELLTTFSTQFLPAARVEEVLDLVFTVHVLYVGVEPGLPHRKLLSHHLAALHEDELSKVRLTRPFLAVVLLRIELVAVLASPRFFLPFLLLLFHSLVKHIHLLLC